MGTKEYLEKLNDVCQPVFESFERKIKNGEIVYANDVVRACKVACEKEEIEFPFNVYWPNNNIGWVTPPISSFR